MHIKLDTYRKSVAINLIGNGLRCRLTATVIKLESEHESDIRVALEKLQSTYKTEKSSRKKKEMKHDNFED